MRRFANSSRSGLTLIELLVVVSILLLLIGVSVPLLKPALEEGRLREAARQVNAYFAMAKARAVELERPAGVWLQRSEADPDACFDLFLAEMPQPYSGDLLGASVALEFDSSIGTNGAWKADQQSNFRFFDSDLLAATTSGAIVQPGEVFFIRFNFKGPLYRMLRDSTSTQLFLLEDGFPPPIEARTSPGVPFQIFRSPERTSSRTLQLSGGACIDLENSGIGIDGYGTLDSGFAARTALDAELPVIIMFFPGGGIERIVWRNDFSAPTSTVHLMLGKLDGLEASDNSPDSPNGIVYSAQNNVTVTYNKNLANRANYWVSIGHRSGMIATSENAWELLPPPPWPGGTPPRPFFQSSLRAAREFAHSGLMSGGR